MNRPANSFQNRLLKSQQSVAYIASLAYVLFVLLATLVDPPGPFPQAFSLPEFSFALLISLCCLAVWAIPKWIRWIYLVAFVGYLAALSFEISRLLSEGQSPLQVCLWQTVNVLVAFLILGSRWGGATSVLTLLTMLVVLLTQGHYSGGQLADWLTVSLTLVTTSAIAHVIMTFTEGNSLTHAQDLGKLHAARQDALTAVYGRGAIAEELERAMAYAQQHNTPMSIILTDIDHFKSVNDLYGHATGDDVLRAFAKRLRRNVGSGGGVVGRWGGEEFIVLLPGLAKPEALVIAGRLRREIVEQPLGDLSVTASFGVASYRGRDDTTDQLFGRADQAMYEAKNAGRNLVR